MSGAVEQLPTERRLAVQFAIARAFAEGESLADVSDLVLMTLADALGWEAATLWVLDGDDRLRCEAAVPRDGALASWTSHCLALRLRVGEGLPGRVWATRQAIWVRDTNEEPNFPRRRAAAEAGLRHGFAFPILVRGTVAAVVDLFAASVRDVDAEQMAFLDAVAHQLGSFIERIEARRAVAESEARKAAILAGAVDAIVSADSAGRIIDFNPAAERLFGWTRTEAIGRTIAELLVPPELRAAHVAGLSRYVTTGERRILGQRIRTRGARADGSTVPIELTITEVEVHGRSMFTAFVRDITREREAEVARDRFLEILSHELRTPVTAIYGGAKVLARPSLGPGSRADLLADIGAEADRLHRLVEDLIVLARAERGADTITLEPVLLDRIAQRVVASVADRWPALEFRLVSDGAPHAVQGDETYVEQVLRNLLSNAGKYAASGHSVEVAIDHERDESTVRVLDRGPGIDDAEATRLFEIDYRSTLTDALAHGSGIGLFVARWLVETMGGRIWARPRDGGGSEFGFALRAIDPDSGYPSSDEGRFLALEDASPRVDGPTPEA